MRRLHHSVIGEYVFLVSFLVQLCFNRMAQLRANYERERPFRHEPRVSAAYPSSNHPDKFFVTVLEKDPGISSMNIDTMLCGASTSMKASRAAPPPWPHVVHILRARVFPHIVSLETEFLFRGRPQAHIMSWVIDIPAIVFFFHSQSALPLTSVNSVVSSTQLSSRGCAVDLWRWEPGAVCSVYYSCTCSTGASSPLFKTQERVFKDPSMCLYEYNERSLLASIPICVYNVHCLANFGHIYNLATQN